MNICTDACLEIQVPQVFVCEKMRLLLLKKNVKIKEYKINKILLIFKIMLH